MLITLVVYVVVITSPPYITYKTGEDPMVSRLVYRGGVPSIPPYMGYIPPPSPVSPLHIAVFGASKGGIIP